MQGQKPNVSEIIWTLRIQITSKVYIHLALDLQSYNLFTGARSKRARTTTSTSSLTEEEEGLVESMSQTSYNSRFLGLTNWKILAPPECIEASSQLFREIHSMFDAPIQKLDEAPAPYNTRSSSSSCPPTRLNLGDSWSDSVPAFLDSSRSASHSSDNQGEMTVPGKMIS
jgi:hypothetical protein